MKGGGGAEIGQKLFLQRHGEIVRELTPEEFWRLAGDKGTIEIWDLASVRQIALWNDHKGPVQVAFAPDGKLLASASEDGSVKLWDWPPTSCKPRCEPISV